ncbi:hypothetical protein R1flu_002730 [Riccia fluitans]|uniref:Phytocyanin domain-containing protein n=1 Tax=Riccia fluitans TaxID=41844 RepID=A0ABD1Y748_9MARC
MTGSLRLIGGACLALSMALVLIIDVNAESYNVGEASWTIPATTNELNYTSWAASINFRFGDELVFTYPYDLHDVLRVNHTDYDTCACGFPIASYSSGHDTIPLNDPGVTDYYFICGKPSHCFLGQKLKVSLVGLVPNSTEVDPQSTLNTPPSKSAAHLSTSLHGYIQLGISAALVLIVS